MAPRRGVLATVLVGFAQRKIQVIAVDEAGGRRSLVLQHPHDLRVGEPVALKVRKAPVRVTEIRASHERRAVAIDGLRRLPDCLQCMAKPQRYVPGRWRVRPHAAIDLDRLVVLPEPDRRRRRLGAIIEILRVEGQQLVNLDLRIKVPLPLDQRLGIVVAGEAKVRRDLQHRLQQGLGVVERVVDQPDAGQEAHSVGMVPGLQQEGADHLLRRSDHAVMEQRRRLNDLGRQGLQRLDVTRSEGRIHLIPLHAI